MENAPTKEIVEYWNENIEQVLVHCPNYEHVRREELEQKKEQETSDEEMNRIGKFSFEGDLEKPESVQ